MSKGTREYTIFLASPSGMEKEHKAFGKAVEVFNKTASARRSVRFAVDGSEFVAGGQGRPQALINPKLIASDFFIMLLWDRWGQDSGAFSSGTEEEYTLARKCLGRGTMRDIVILFKVVRGRRLRSRDQRVLEFKRSLDSVHECLYHDFCSIEDFLFRTQIVLNSWLGSIEQGFDKLQPQPRSQMLYSRRLPLASSDLGAVELLRIRKMSRRGAITDAELAYSELMDTQKLSPNLLNDYALFLMGIGRFAEATGVFQQLSEVQMPSYTCVLAMIGLGRLSMIQRRFEEATAYFTRAKIACEGLDMAELLSEVLCRLADVYRVCGSRAYNKAKALLLEANRLAELSRNDESRADAFSSMAALYRDRAFYVARDEYSSSRDRARAFKYYDRAKRIFEARNDNYGLAVVLNDIGVLWLRESRPRFYIAESCFRRALEINIGRWPEHEADNRFNLGEALSGLALERAAETELSSALRLYIQLGLIEQARKAADAMKNLGGRCRHFESIVD